VKPSGERVIRGSVMIGADPVTPDKTYRLCTKDYLVKGKDGYECLVGSQVLVNEEDGPQLSTIIQNHFQSVSYLSGLCKLKYCHHQSIISRRERKSLSRQATIEEQEVLQELQSVKDDESGGRRRWQKARIALSFARQRSINEAESKEVKAALAPTVQRRIKNSADGSV